MTNEFVFHTFELIAMIEHRNKYMKNLFIVKLERYRDDTLYGPNSVHEAIVLAQCSLIYCIRMEKFSRICKL